ncbi:MAG: methyltransferase domain-containing protein [Phycisphaerae bacterium]|jgi:SAM-dependent methyltransferase
MPEHASHVDSADRAGQTARDRDLFDRIAEAYCRKDLHPTSRAARRQRLRRTLAGVPAGRDIAILEPGCGAGFAATYLRGRYRAFHGIDHSEKLIDYARAHNGDAGVTFEVADINAYEPATPPDVILMIGVLHHLADLDAALARMVGWLRPGGWLAANEPHPGNPLVCWARRIRQRVDAEYSDEQEELSEARLRAAYGRCGLVDIRIRPQGLFSTPFAEVVLQPTIVTFPTAVAACLADTALEATLGGLLKRLSWNLVAVGRKPGPSSPTGG